MRWVMVLGPLAVAIACGGRSERVLGEDAGAGGDGGDDTGGSAGKGGKGGAPGKGGGAGKGAAGGTTGDTGGTGGSTGGSGGTFPSKGGTGGRDPGKGGSGGTFPGKGGSGGTFPGKGGSPGVGGFSGFGGSAGRFPVGGSAGTGFGGFGAVAGAGGFGGAGGFAGAGGSGGKGFGGSAGVAGFGGNGGSGGSTNQCMPNPCLNGGICVPGVAGNLSCECPVGFTGSRCELASSPCPDTPCMHGGTCVIDPEGAYCACPTGWSGVSCECHVTDEAVGGGCRLQSVCGLPEPQTYASGNCSGNTEEFAEWWCQLAGYDGALSYETVVRDPFEALYYNGGEREVLSECSQLVHTNNYFYGPTCTGVSNLVCDATPRDESLRGVVLVCGISNRNVREFLPPEASALSVQDGCSPDLTTQALLVTRDGTASLTDSTALRAYLQAGGVLLTEHSNSAAIFSRVFPETIPGSWSGSCNDNAPTTVQFNPSDRFWLDNPYEYVPPADTGCGYDVTLFPHLVALAGWATDRVALGYRDLGRGRFWATDFDWADGDSGQTDYTRNLLGYMITHRR